MKAKFIRTTALLSMFVCIGILSLFPTYSYSQKEVNQVISAHDNADEAIVTADSVLYFSSYSPDFILIRDNAQELNREQFWQMVQTMHLESKVVSEIISVKIKGKVAWILYHYKFSNDDKYKEHVNHVSNLEDYRWVATAILEKNGKKWQLVLHQYATVPRE